MAEQSQNYKNHARFLPAYHFFVVPVLLLNVIVALWQLWMQPAFNTGFAVIVAMALLTLGLLSRVMVLAVQDRVIRLEMQLRLREVLPPDLKVRIPELTLRQLVALRFASDAEMAELVRDVLAGRLAAGKEIKIRVKEWQADRVRA